MDKNFKGFKRSSGVAKPFKKNLGEERLKKLQAHLKDEQIKKQLLEEAAKNKSVHTKGRQEKRANELDASEKKGSKFQKLYDDNKEVDRKKQTIEGHQKTVESPSKKRCEVPKNIVSSLQNQVFQEKTHYSTMNPNNANIKNTSVETLNGSNDSQMEPMEWEEATNEEQNSSESYTLVVESKQDPNINLSEFETIGEYLKYKDILNADVFDEKHFYIVVDTNVFLADLTYIESLSKMNFPNLGYPIIVIPFVVLQELDNLKHRSSDDLASRSKSAINFINEKFRQSNVHFQGQSAKDETKHLISIKAPDDHIINCILQVQEKMGNIVIGLSNDKNLRNKIIVNSIDAYSVDDLKVVGDELQIT